jgi:hypothetical protein
MPTKQFEIGVKLHLLWLTALRNRIKHKAVFPDAEDPWVPVSKNDMKFLNQMMSREWKTFI